MNKICIIRSERAHLPEIEAYSRVLGSRFEVEFASDLSGDLQERIVWCFMGLHSKRPDSRFLIHDYRSLSTGFGKVVKDQFKRRINARPDLRVFLNPEVERIMNFKDGVPSCHLDMGVPDSIEGFRSKESSFRYEFCYIGNMSKERKSHLMIDAFLKSKYKNQPFLLIGMVDQSIRDSYVEIPTLHFVGKMAQNKVFEMLAECRYAISHFPYHRPHCYQTPTKLLEYACLGKAIIANRSPSNLRTADHYKIHVQWGGEHVFNNLILSDKLHENSEFDPEPIFWGNRFLNSGIWKYLEPFV